MFDSSFTWGSHVDIIISKTKQRLAQLCHLSSYLEPIDLPTYNVQVFCLEHGHLLYFLYFGTARSHLEYLGALQRQAASVL